MGYRTFILIALFLQPFFLQAQENVSVRVYSNKVIQSFDVVIFSGTYQLQDSTGHTQKLFNKGDTLHVRSFDKSIMLSCSTDTIFFNHEMDLRGVGFMNIFQVFTLKTTRLFDDGLSVRYREDGSLWLINNVALEHYVSGVVQAEAGIAKNSEFYKVQAVAVRTFTLKNKNKHQDEGFQLCDQTCCQVFKGRCANTEIMIATSKTAGQVMVDTTGEIIIAVFHSNSGGQTANSEDVWGKPLSYLRAVNDPYSISQTSYSWQKTMARSEWLNYLKNNFSYPVSDARAVEQVTHFTQTGRKVFLANDISLRKIREDLNLRSTFFNITEKGDEIIFEGKGYGHGVGLSQEGAINMARQGFSYIDILNFYYTGIEIKTIDEIDSTP